MSERKPSEVIFDEPTDGTVIDGESRVIVFNDEVHTFQEVEEVLIRATGCPLGRAKELSMEIHTKGKANVYEGELNECLRVSGIIEGIGLQTQVEV